jgi:membrane-associated phospholipid phosphatase
LIESETIAAQTAPKTAVGVLSISTQLRVSEKLILVFLTYVSAAATFFRVSVTQGLTIATLNLATSGVIALLSRFSTDRNIRSRGPGKPDQGPVPKPGILRMTLTPKNGESELLGVIRDWFPAIVILLAYRESGLLGLPDPSHRLDTLFEGWDRVLLQNPWVLAALNLGSPWLTRYLEFCYSLCYPLVPLGLAALYLLRECPGLRPDGQFEGGRAIDRFWTTVLLALFTCYALFPLFPSSPPRLLFHDLPGPVVHPVFRKLNFWILGQYGIQSSVFPSGHVAAVTATALAVRAHWPRAGTVFAIAAVSVGVATVIGRYHYSADAVAGALIGVVAFLVSSRLHRM